MNYCEAEAGDGAVFDPGYLCEAANYKLGSKLLIGASETRRLSAAPAAHTSHRALISVLTQELN